MDSLAERLERALTRFRVQTAHNLLDEAFAAAPPDVIARGLVLPLCARIESGGDDAVSRFTSSLLEIRLLAEARGWDRLDGPRVTLACAPRDHRTLPLITLGLGLAARHCRITYLGGFTPVATLIEQLPAPVVLSADVDDLSPIERADLRGLSPLLIGRAAPTLAQVLGGTALPADLEAATVRAANLAHGRSSRQGDVTSPRQP